MIPVSVSAAVATPTAIERQKNELARILNVDGIKTGNPKWLALMREGVVVKLHVRRWRAKSRLDMADLGLPSETDDLIGDLLNLGDKRLLPKDLASRLEAIESAGRKALERNGYSTFWGTFIPASNFDAWKAENDAHKRRYLDARNELRDSYSDIVAQLTDAYRGAARAAFRRAKALDPGVGQPMTRLEAQRHLLDEDQFVNLFVRRITRQIPTENQIYDSFGWEEELTYIPLPSLLAEDAAEKDRIQAEREPNASGNRWNVMTYGARSRSAMRPTALAATPWPA